MKIRNATKIDIRTIAKLMLEEFRKPPFNERVSLDAVIKSMNFYFKLGKIYVVTEKKEIIGVLVFKTEQYWEGPVIIIEDLAVKNNFKKQGVGKMLMSYVESYAKNNSIKRVLSLTNKKSLAIKFCKKIGYKPLKNVINFEKKIIIT